MQDKKNLAVGMIDLHRFTFNLQGLQFFYSISGINYHVTLDPCATCDLFKEGGLIEDFTTDANFEPVILFSDNTFPEGYGFDRWNSFVICFPLNYKMAKVLVELREEKRFFDGLHMQIEELLAPLKATA